MELIGSIKEKPSKGKLKLYDRSIFTQLSHGNVHFSAQHCFFFNKERLQWTQIANQIFQLDACIIILQVE